MAAPKGHKKWGGRAKGTPNKVKAQLLAIATEALGREPLLELCEFYKNASDPGLKLGALKEICSYCHPKQRSMEVTGADGGPVQMQALAVTNEERQALVEQAKAEQNA